MKKFLAIVCCLALCLSFAACSNSDTKPADDNNSGTNQSEGTGDNQSESNVTADLEKYIESIQSLLDSTAETLKEGGIEMKVYAENNSLVYSYQYSDSSIPGSELKGTLDEGLEAEKDTFTSSLKEIQDAVPGTESIIVKYLDSNGDEITSREFK